MDVNMQAVLRFQNSQAINPHVPFSGDTVATAAAQAVPVREEPPAEPAPAPAPEPEQPNG